MMPTGKQTVGMLGKAEPGWARFADVRTQQGTKEAALEEYARFFGIVRRLSPKPLLDLSVVEVEALDRVLLGKSAPVRVVLRMFYTVHKRHDLLDALPRQKRTKARRIALHTVLMPEDVQAIIAVCSNLRDRAILATLATTGGRIGRGPSYSLIERAAISANKAPTPARVAPNISSAPKLSWLVA